MKWIKLSALFICTVLGAGFATGRELFIYFVSYGIWGIIGIVISAIIFGLTVYKTLLNNYSNVGDIFSFPLNIIFSSVVFLFLIVLYSAMLSASGELFKNVFNIPYIWGVLAMTALSQWAISGGNKGIMDLSLVLCPFMLVISVIVSIYILTQNNVQIHNAEFNYKFIYSAFIYTAYNIITAVTVLIGENDKNSAVKTAISSCIIIGLLALVLSLPLYFNYDLISDKPLPLIYLLPKGNIITLLYIFMLVSAIFTTAVSNGFSAAKQINKPTIYITLSALLISFLGFDVIVGKVYFLFGLLGILLLVNLFITKR